MGGRWKDVVVAIWRSPDGRKQEQHACPCEMGAGANQGHWDASNGRVGRARAAVRTVHLKWMSLSLRLKTGSGFGREEEVGWLVSSYSM